MCEKSPMQSNLDEKTVEKYDIKMHRINHVHINIRFSTLGVKVSVAFVKMFPLYL